jgi:hypothetical protein
VVYAFLADGRDERQLRELDMALAPTPEDKQAHVDKANMDAMKQLQASLGGMTPPGRRV